MKIEDRNFLMSIFIAILLAGILSLIPLWQLVIIAGIFAGFLNKSMKRGTLSGAIGVFIFWLIFIVFHIVAINAYSLLDQFGALLISTGFGWLILIIILLVGTLLGALGGTIGSGLLMLLKGTESSENVES
jgi:hypothetical protein